MILQPVYYGGGTGSGDSSIQSIAADCDAGDTVGDVVYVSADKIGSQYQVTKVNIDSAATVEAIGIGIIGEKPTSTTCTVYLSGVLPGIYSGLVPGKRLFVDTNARLSQAPMSSSSHRISQKVAYALASDVVYFRPEEPIRFVL